MKRMKGKNISEYLIGAISLIVGSLLIYNSVYFIYAYNFTGTLFLMMFSMTTLIPELIIGLFLVASAVCLLTFKNPIAISLYRFTSVIIILFPLNETIISLIEYPVYDEIIIILHTLIIITGILLYLFFNQKKYIYNKKLKRYTPLLGIFLYLCIDIIFFNWCYRC